MKKLFLIITLNSIFIFGIFAQGNNSNFQAILDKAQAGDAGSMNLLGNIYNAGSPTLGLDKNPKEAKKWYEASADKGYPSAFFNLGLIYEKGEIVEKSLPKAIEYYQKAANLGNASAKKKLEIIGSSAQSPTPEVANLNKNQQNSVTQSLQPQPKQPVSEVCADLYNSKQYEKALTFSKPEADKGDGICQYVIALIYWKGQSVPKNYQEAEKYMLLAAKNDIKSAKQYIDAHQRLYDIYGAIWIDEAIAIIGEGSESTKKLADTLEQMQESAVNWNTYNMQFKRAIQGTSGYQNIAKPKLDAEAARLKELTKQFVSQWKNQGTEFQKKFNGPSNRGALVAPNGPGGRAVIKVLTDRLGQIEKINLIEEGNAYEDSKPITLYSK